MLLLLLTFFKINFFKKNSFKNSLSLSNGLDQDWDQHSVCPDLGPIVCKGYQNFRRQKLPASNERIISQ